jgi:hypothetical protein
MIDYLFQFIHCIISFNITLSIERKIKLFKTVIYIIRPIINALLQKIQTFYYI